MIDWRKIFGGDKKSNTASTARDRLMVVVGKYVQVPDTAVQVQVQQKDGLEVIEMDITLPEEQRISL